MIDLAAERACLGALLTGALASRDVEADLFAHPHHARLCRALMAWRGDDKRARPLSTIPLVAFAPGMPMTAPPLPRAWAFVVVDGAPVSLLSLARSAPKRWPALEAVRVLRDLVGVRDDVRRDREAVVSAFADLCERSAGAFVRWMREGEGLLVHGGEDGAYVRPIDADAVPDARTLVREVAARLTVA